MMDRICILIFHVGCKRTESFIFNILACCVRKVGVKPSYVMDNRKLSDVPLKAMLGWVHGTLWVFMLWASSCSEIGKLELV